MTTAVSNPPSATPPVVTTPPAGDPPPVVPAASGTPPVSPVVTPPAQTPTPGQTPPPVTTPPAPAAPPVLTLKAPDGSLLDAGAVERTTAQVAKLGLSPEHAQEVLEHVHKEVAAFQSAREAQAQQLMKHDWIEQVKNDPEIGGAKYEESMRLCALARHKCMRPAFLKMLDDTGLGNHPENVYAWRYVGSLLAEANLITTGDTPPAPPAKKDPLAVLYPSTYQAG